MAITYDFDMFSIMPKELQAQFGEMFSEIGMTEAVKEQRALFRDPAAVRALQGASEEVRQCLLDSGFGINVYDSGAGPGRFPPSDENARMSILGRLRQNLRRVPPDADWNGFDIRAFMRAAAEARPIDTQARSLAEMRGKTADRPVQPQTPDSVSNMDDFFSGRPANPQRAAPAASLDDFFSARPSDTHSQTTSAEPAPNMDAFFANTPSPRPQAAPPRMTAEDIRMTIDTSPPPKVGIGPIKMVLMALALFAVVAMLGGGTGGNKLIQLATGGELISIKP